LVTSRGRGILDGWPDNAASINAAIGLNGRALATSVAESEHAAEISRSNWTCGFLAALPAGLKASLTEGACEISHPSGRVVHSPDTRPRPGVIVDGLVRVYFSSPEGREASVSYLGPGQAIGLVGIFAPGEATSLQAVVDTKVLYFDEKRFTSLLSTEAALGLAVAGSLADRIAAWSHSFYPYVFSTVRVRVAAHLLALASPDDDGRLVAETTQQELANAVGSVRDVVARVLREMRRDGMVRSGHKRVVLTDQQGLEREAGSVLARE
jgi:CRP/FNR family transcriptional regulator